MYGAGYMLDYSSKISVTFTSNQQIRYQSHLLLINKSEAGTLTLYDDLCTCDNLAHLIACLTLVHTVVRLSESIDCQITHIQHHTTVKYYTALYLEKNVHHQFKIHLIRK